MAKINGTKSYSKSKKENAIGKKLKKNESITFAGKSTTIGEPHNRITRSKFNKNSIENKNRVPLDCENRIRTMRSRANIRKTSAAENIPGNKYRIEQEIKLDCVSQTRITRSRANVQIASTAEQILGEKCRIEQRSKDLKQTKDEIYDEQIDKNQPSSPQLFFGETETTKSIFIDSNIPLESKSSKGKKVNRSTAVTKTVCFSPGEICFAKMKGYRAWPAKVSDF